MSRSTDKWQPFFHVLRKRVNFTWDKKADEAFQALKTYLAHLPRITNRLPGEHSNSTWRFQNRLLVLYW